MWDTSTTSSPLTNSTIGYVPPSASAVIHWTSDSASGSGYTSYAPKRETGREWLDRRVQEICKVGRVNNDG